MLLREALETGREAFDTRAWGRAYTSLTAVEDDDRLGIDDLERLALAAHLTGHDDDYEAAFERMHRACLDAGDAERAARCAFWLAFELFRRGQAARGGGWLGRAHTVLAEHGVGECAVHGLLLLPQGLQQLGSGDTDAAFGTFDAARAVGRRFGDADVVALGLLGRGQALVARGEVDQGLHVLDETMVAVSTDAVSPMVVGIVHCAVIETCQLAFDLRRACEWTEELTRWCAEQPDLVPYRGQCLVYRGQMLALRGRWPAALEEVRRARERLADPPGQPAVGMAWYEIGELLRLQGRHDEAEECYRKASRHDHLPMPGLPLLRLAQGRLDEARAAVDGALGTPGPAGLRWRLLAAAVEIRVAAGDAAGARKAADELAASAADVEAAHLRAMAEVAEGRVLMTEGDAPAASVALRGAWDTWRELDVPYEAARTRVLLGSVCRSLGDTDGAALEWDAARCTFEQLGAVDDLAAVHALLPAPGGRPGGLTGRELEVLRLVARGHTNRDIAAELFLSEHTVRRHMQNVFARLGVSSRAAATAYALQHDLL